MFMEMESIDKKHSHLGNYILVPKTFFWTFVGGIIIAVLSAWISLVTGFAKVEKEIEILKVRFDKDEKLITENTKKFEEIQSTLYEIKMELIQKKDKKYVE